MTVCVAASVSPERAADYRQAVECAARNPCKHGKRISNPDGVTEFCRAFGTFILVDTPSRGFVLRTSPPACIPSRPSAFVDPSLFGQTVLLPSFRRGWGRWSAPTAGCRPVVPSSGEEGLGVVAEQKRSQPIKQICRTLFFSTTPHPSFQKEGTTLGALPARRALNAEGFERSFTALNARRALNSARLFL